MTDLRFKIAALAIGVGVGFIAIGVGFLIASYKFESMQARMDSMQARIVKLERACGPVYTGGGVWQCAQPNVRQAPPRP